MRTAAVMQRAKTLPKHFTGKESLEIFHDDENTKKKVLATAINLGRSLIIYPDRKDAPSLS